MWHVGLTCLCCLAHSHASSPCLSPRQSRSLVSSEEGSLSLTLPEAFLITRTRLREDRYPPSRCGQMRPGGSGQSGQGRASGPKIPNVFTSPRGKKRPS